MLKRVINVIKGWMHIGVNDLENNNIDALIANLEAEKEEAVAKIHATLVEAKANINSIEKDRNAAEREYKAYEEAANKALDVNKESLAADLALKAEESKQRYLAFKQAFEEAEKSYGKVADKQRLIIDEYDNALRDVRNKSVQVKLKESLAAIKDKTNLSGSNSFGGQLAKVNKLLDRKDSVASAECEVSDDLNREEIDITTFQSVTNKKDALARLKAKRAESAPAPEAPKKKASK